jgi:hypothetical protein
MAGSNIFANVASDDINNEDRQFTGQQPEVDGANGSSSIFKDGIGGSKDGTGGSQGNDPAATAGADPDATPKPRRRGRPPGSRNRASTGEEKDGLALGSKELIEQLKGYHAMLAMMLPEPLQPVILLSDDEAMRLGKALANVQKHYQLTINGPKAALIYLVGTCASIYIPKLLFIRMVAAQARTQARTPPSQAPTPDDTNASRAPTDGEVFDLTGARVTNQLKKQGL